MEVKYYKIRADFKYSKKGRFYRTFLVREGISLQDLGEFIVEIFGGEMEHCFLYTMKGKSFEPLSWIEDWGSDDGSREAYNDKTIEDLPSSFTFEYDTGEGWDFSCKIYDKMVVKEFDDEEYKDDEELIPTGFVLDGKGMGIWEDNIGSLYAYLEGEIDQDYNLEDEERGIYKPWNFEIDKYSEFDDPIDIEELNEIAMDFFPIAYYENDEN